jgi:7-cyano-7-deazaguanine tRNA-ribosyltransferase
MSVFRVDEEGDDGYGRLGTLDLPSYSVDTPALFPVINLIGGTTKKSGGVWRRMRDRLMSAERLQGIMFQAMSFIDYGVSPKNLNEFWRTETFHEKFEELSAPVFIDSGGFKLMNSDTFGAAPSEGGAKNEWGLYTNPESILGLQLDFGADIIATLDYPVPPNLNAEEREERMLKSIESSIRCLQLLDDPSQLDPDTFLNPTVAERIQSGGFNPENGGQERPGVYVAIHGHDDEWVSWYVQKFIERVEEEDLEGSFEGFAIGSLVPLRSSIDVLVNIVNGAKQAIKQKGLDDEVGIHVFGVGGKQVGLLSLLGADSFDCSSHMQTAMYKKYLIPETWEHIKLDDLEPRLDDGQFPCSLEHCPLCSGEYDIDYELLNEELNLSLDYDERQARKANDEWIKSDYYALLAGHNFEVYNAELQRVRDAISDGRLLEYVVNLARDHADIAKGLKQAQVQDPTNQLTKDLRELGAEDLIPGPWLRSEQKQLTEWGGGASDLEPTQTISLKHRPSDFYVLQQKFEPPSEKDVLLLIPCSQVKPYSESRTHSVLWDKLGSKTRRIHKVTVSGMYGPVPQEMEEKEPVLEYEYVLANEDTKQRELVTKRVTEYLEQYGEEYDHIVGYVASSNYRQVIEDAFTAYGRGEVFPRNPRALQLTEHFRNENIQQLIDYLEEHPADLPTSHRTSTLTE